jgi:hypothetical protein
VDKNLRIGILGIQVWHFHSNNRLSVKTQQRFLLKDKLKHKNLHVYFIYITWGKQKQLKKKQS